jgi:hypothetical protein
LSAIKKHAFVAIKSKSQHEIKHQQQNHILSLQTMIIKQTKFANDCCIKQQARKCFVSSLFLPLFMWRLSTLEGFILLSKVPL